MSQETVKIHKSQSLLHQRTVSGDVLAALAGARLDVSIASSSANSFRPPVTEQDPPSEISLNRFFISEQFPAAFQ